MNVVIFGASGMVGQGVLRECVMDPAVEKVVVVGRSRMDAIPGAAAGRATNKVQELIVSNPGDLSGVEDQLGGLDACFFCLGVSAAGLTEAQYRVVTYDLTLGAAGTLARLNPELTFIYVSGTGTDSTGTGRVMWARVKGQTENALFKLPIKAAVMFRPGVIRPMYGVKSRTRLYRVFYILFAPLMPLLHRLFPRQITTTENVGRAMLQVAKRGAPKRWLENSDIEALAAQGRARLAGEARPPS